MILMKYDINDLIINTLEMKSELPMFNPCTLCDRNKQNIKRYGVY